MKKNKWNVLHAQLFGDKCVIPPKLYGWEHCVFSQHGSLFRHTVKNIFLEQENLRNIFLEQENLGNYLKFSYFFLRGPTAGLGPRVPQK